MSMEPEDYRRQGATFLAQAWEELERGDLRQASEKGWGAVSQQVRALASFRNLELHRHRDVSAFVDSISTEVSDPTIYVLFGTAESLHANFYEGYMSYFNVHYGLGQAQELIDKLDVLLASKNGLRGTRQEED